VDERSCKGLLSTNTGVGVGRVGGGEGEGGHILINQSRRSDRRDLSVPMA